jgi:hypothetical protein
MNLCEKTKKTATFMFIVIFSNTTSGCAGDQVAFRGCQVNGKACPSGALFTPVIR